MGKDFSDIQFVERQTYLPALEVGGTVLHHAEGSSSVLLPLLLGDGRDKEILFFTVF